MSEVQCVLFELEGSGSDSAFVERKAHVRQKLVYRRAIDPKLQIFDYALEIPEDHFVRGLRRFILAMDLGILDACYDDRGGIPYDPRDCLGAILLGMKEGVRSGAALERACRYDVRYRYVAGGQTPDKRTFQRIKKRFNSQLKSLHSSVLKKGRYSKRACGAEVAVDGTKMSGSSSAWKPKDGGEPSDPDVRMMESHGRKCLGYNVQIAVDTSGPDRMILGCTVIQDQNDLHAMPKIIQATLEQCGELPVQVLADKGYETTQSIEHLENRGVQSLICPSDNIPGALMENADGVLVCPVGRPLIYKATRSSKESRSEKIRFFDVYRPEGGCAGCPLTASCTFYRKDLRVQPNADPGARFRNRDRVQSQGGAGAMIRRRLVEQPIAYMKRHTRFDRFLTRGLENVQTEMLLWVISYNIFKLLKASQDAFWLILAFFGQQRHPLPTCICISKS
jgi:transposase